MSNIVFAFPVTILLALIILLPILVGVYVYRDAKRRGMNAVLWMLIALLAPSLIGFIIYLLVRGNYSNLKCPRCETLVTEQYVICPKCGAKLRPSCPNCATPVELDWRVCPKCAQPLQGVQDDIVTPIRPKDKTLWKIIVAIVLIPAIMLVGVISFFSINSGSSSFLEVSTDTYFADEKLPESTKEYVREWMNTLSDEDNQVYALRFGYQVLEDSKEKDYYYLIYIPECGNVSNSSFGYSAGLFGGELELELNGNGGEETLYCMIVSEKRQAPGLRVIWNGKRLEDVVTVVDFNPTLYTIATEDDYSMLIEASGDIYSENGPDKTKANSLSITKLQNGKELDVLKYEEADLLLNTVVKIHELTTVDNTPEFLDGNISSDYYILSIDFADATGETDFKNTVEYIVVEQDGEYYLADTKYEFVYQISKEVYGELEMLFK